LLSRLEDGSVLRSLAEAAARSVGPDLVAAFYNGMKIERKQNFHDVVSKHDRETEERLVDFIIQECPNSSFVGEEYGRQGDGVVEWYIDPIDGTENFVSGIPFFCVSIAAAIHETVVAGVVFDPIRDECFSADRNGAYINSEPVEAIGAVCDEEALLIVGFPDHQPWLHAPAGYLPEVEFIRMVNSFRTVRRLGASALSLAYVAAGRADVAFDVNVHSWDVAAGSYLVDRAGGEYVPLGDESFPLYSAPGYLAFVRGFRLRDSALATVAAASAEPVRTEDR
jgi:myo-inositol-1(or 4)-monophosphatase